MRTFVSLLAEETTDAVATFEFSWTMVITLSLSVILAFVFIILILPRKKKSPAISAMAAADKFLSAATDFASHPSKDNLKKLRKRVAFTDALLVSAIYKGLVEMNPAQAMTEESLKICKSLTVSKADESRRAEFSKIILDNAKHIIDIVLPYAGKEADDGLIALTQRSGATAYLDSVKRTRGDACPSDLEDQKKDDNQS